MKKQLVIIGIVALLVFVGLSGCTNIVTTNIGDISAGPQNYINKTVTVEGTCSTLLMGNGWISDQSGHQLDYKFQNSLTGKYRLIGIIKYGQINPASAPSYYIDVQTANAIS